MTIKTLEDVVFYINWLFDYRGYTTSSGDF